MGDASGSFSVWRRPPASRAGTSPLDANTGADRATDAEPRLRAGKIGANGCLSCSKKFPAAAPAGTAWFARGGSALLKRGAIRCPLGLPASGLQMGSRRGETERSQSVLRASIALRAARRCGHSAVDRQLRGGEIQTADVLSGSQPPLRLIRKLPVPYQRAGGPAWITLGRR